MAGRPPRQAVRESPLGRHVGLHRRCAHHVILNVTRPSEARRSAPQAGQEYGHARARQGQEDAAPARTTGRAAAGGRSRKRRAAQEDLALREGLAGLGSRQRRFTSEGEGWTRRGGPRRSSSFTAHKLPLSLPPRAKRRPGGMLPAPSPRAHTSHECVPSGLFHTSSSVTRPWMSKD